MKLQMKREALTKIKRQANEGGPGFGTVLAQQRHRMGESDGAQDHNSSRFSEDLVGAGRFERPTPCAQGRCATRLRYAPTFAYPLILD